MNHHHLFPAQYFGGPGDTTNGHARWPFLTNSRTPTNIIKTATNSVGRNFDGFLFLIGIYLVIPTLRYLSGLIYCFFEMLLPSSDFQNLCQCTVVGTSYRAQGLLSAPK
jgi:hypothetical protein